MNKEKTKKIGNFAFVAAYLKKLHRYFIGASIATCIAAAMSLVLPLLFSFIVDYVLVPTDDGAVNFPIWIINLYEQTGGRDFYINRLWIMGLLLLAVMAIDGLFSWMQGRLTARYNEDFTRQLRIDLFDRVQHAPFAYLSRTETGDLIQRFISDTDTLRRFLGQQLQEGIRCLILVVVSASVMFSVNWQMGLISIALTPLIVVSAYRYFKNQQRSFLKWDEAEGDLSTLVQEHLTGVRVVKAFAKQKYEVDRFHEKNSILKKHASKTMAHMADFWMISDLLCYLQIAVVGIVGVYQVVNGNLTAGAFIVFISYVDRLLFPLRQLARIVGDTSRAGISAGRLKEVMDAPNEPDDKELEQAELKGGVEFRNVSFRYKDEEGNQKVLHDLSFKVESGQTVGILGPTGSGKSTLLHLLARLYDPDEGQILFDDKDATTLSRYSIRKQVGYLLQEPFVFSRSIRDNIALTRPDASEQVIRKVAQIASFESEITQFDQGYNTMVGERGTTLSGGQKQRLAIARTLLRDCPILVFDDSLSAVDTTTDLEIRRHLKDETNTKTVFLITHRITSLSAADLILVLDNGQIIEQGSHNELIRKDGLYKRVYDLQNSDNPLETVSDKTTDEMEVG